MIYLLRHGDPDDSALIARMQKHVPDSLLARYERKLSACARRESILSGALLGLALRIECGLVPKDVGIVADENGKPRFLALSSLHFNLSHCRGLSVCAFGRHEMGVDVEQIRPFDPGVAERVCTDDELQAIDSHRDPADMFFRHWVLKESYCKAVGRGLSHSMRDVSFRIKPKQITSNKSGCTFFLFEHIKGYHIALCVLDCGKEGEACYEGGICTVY